MKRSISIMAIALSILITVPVFATNIIKGETGNKKFKAGWNLNQYKITYDLDGGMLPSGKTNPGIYSVTSDTFTLNNPEKKEHTFLGWTGSNGNITEKTVKITKGSTGDRSYKASYEINSYKLIFDANGGLEAPETKTVKYKEKYGKLDNPTPYDKEGYTVTFNGWYTDQTGGSLVSEETIMDTSDVTIYAHYSESINSYKLIFDANGGSNAPASKTLEFGQEYGTLEEPKAYEKEGYIITFDGWYDSKSDGNKVSSDTVIKAKDTTIYAHWKEEKQMELTVTDDIDQITEIRVYSSKGTNKDENKYDPEHEFYNIYTNNFTHIPCSSGDRIEIYHEKDRYWVYTDNNKTVHGIGQGSVCSFNVPSEAKGAAALNITEGCDGTDQLELYDSTEWAKAISPELHDIPIIFNISGKKAAKKISKIRVYNPAEKTIDYLPEDYSDNSLYQDIPVYAGYTVEIYHDATRGWNYEKDDKGFELGEDEILSFRVPMTAETEATLNMASDSKNETLNLTESKGWCTEIVPEAGAKASDTVFVSLVDDIKSINKVKVLDKSGNASEYTNFADIPCYPGCDVIIYHNKDSEWKCYNTSGVLKNEVKCGTCSFTIPTNAKNRSWLYVHRTRNGENQKDNLYLDHSAGWIRNVDIKCGYTVKFDPHYETNLGYSGTGTMSNQFFDYDEEKTLNPLGYQKTTSTTGLHYNFKGWNTKPDGSGVSYKDKQSVKNLVIGGEITLYAQWESEWNVYTVTYDATGGTVNPATQKVHYNLAYGTMPIPERKHYIFRGWYDQPSGGSYITNGNRVTKMYDHTLYARWEETGNYTITFNPNGGNCPVSSMKAYSGESIGELPVPTRSRYKFVGWADYAWMKAYHQNPQYPDDYILSNTVLNKVTGSTEELIAIWENDDGPFIGGIYSNKVISVEVEDSNGNTAKYNKNLTPGGTYTTSMAGVPVYPGKRVRIRISNSTSGATNWEVRKRSGTQNLGSAIVVNFTVPSNAKGCANLDLQYDSSTGKHYFNWYSKDDGVNDDWLKNVTVKTGMF